MALPESRFTLRQPAGPVPVPAPLTALARLSQIHSETGDAQELARFLRAGVTAAAALMLLGALALMLAGSAGLQQEFAWALLVLPGVAAMLRCYIRSTAQAFERVPLGEAAQDLRAILFYAGFAWGAGAFLLLGNDPVPFTGLCFALVPTVVFALILKDSTAGLAFLAPVTALTAAAILLEPWGDAGVALMLLLAGQGAIAASLSFTGKTRKPLPAGLALR